jgi:ribosome-associated translation inhibitor RaiA
MDEDMELGGNIMLSGFSDFDRAELGIVKKMVGAYARKFTDSFGVNELKITLKPVHQIENSEKFEIKAAAIKDGKPITSETVDKNVYFAIDSVLKKVEGQLS